MKEVTKDPAERLDFTLDLAAPLALDADTIASHVVTVPTTPAGLVKDADSHTTTAVIAWLKAGTAGSDYPVVFQATTAGGRVYERTVVVRVRNR